jgi:hypothetical protein
MNKLPNSDRNGPIQMSEVSAIDKPWKCSEANNGYLKQKSLPEESLLGSTAVTTVVQVSGTGTKTTVVPRNKQAKEKCLVAAVFALIIFSLVLLFIVVTTKNPQCVGKSLLESSRSSLSFSIKNSSTGVAVQPNSVRVEYASLHDGDRSRFVDHRVEGPRKNCQSRRPARKMFALARGPSKGRFFFLLSAI